jgi:hypothetical protein
MDRICGFEVKKNFVKGTNGGLDGNYYFISWIGHYNQYLWQNGTIQRKCNTDVLNNGYYETMPDVLRAIATYYEKKTKSIIIDDYEVIFEEKGNSIQVGCQTIDFETVEEIYNRMKDKKN